jgi:hypothetical protein
VKGKLRSAAFSLPKGDLWIFIGILAAIVLLLVRQAIIQSSGGQGMAVEIQGPLNELFVIAVDTLPLDCKSHWDLDGLAGGLNLTYEPERGFYIQSAACPDQICVGMGYINKAGQSIVCVPNEIVIRLAVRTKGMGDELDGFLR